MFLLDYFRRTLSGKYRGAANKSSKLRRFVTKSEFSSALSLCSSISQRSGLGHFLSRESIEP